MYDLFLTFRAAALQLLVDILPDSPISDWLESIATQDTAIAQGIAWLNWLVDINGMLLIMDLWLIAIGVYYMSRYGISLFGDLKSYATSFFRYLTGTGELNDIDNNI